MLFLLAMEPLHLLFQKAQQAQILHSITPVYDRFRITLYADDAALFIWPKEHDLMVTDTILNMFAQASGLLTNFAKTQYYPIRCENINLDFLTQAGRNLASFPCTYLGLPLHIKNPLEACCSPCSKKLQISSQDGKEIFSLTLAEKL
jgi:hypothetical protein